MATTALPTYQPYQAPTTDPRFGYSNESDPRKLAANQRSVVQSTGDNLQNADEQLANQYGDQASGVEQYLDPIQSNLAAGNGGYNPSETNQVELSQADKNQIEYSPQDVQSLVDQAGISAGQQTAASVGDAERQAAASGGSPAALATYRARAAQTGAVNAANAETAARVAGKQAQASGASTAQQLQSAGGQAVGNARLGQQNTGLNYYTGLQSEKNSNALSEQGLQQGAYGTQTQGTGQAANIGFSASQTPTGTDKLIGGIAGAASAFLADGDMGYLDPDGQDAVVGENGMEAVINNAPQAVQRGASDPVRSNTRYMDNGTPGAASPTAAPWLDRYLDSLKNNNSQPSGSAPAQPQTWNKTTPYVQAGQAIGKILKPLGQTGQSASYGPRGFAPGSSQMPSSGAPASPAATVVPGTDSDALGPNARPLLDRTGGAGVPMDSGVGGGVDPDLIGSGAADIGDAGADVADAGMGAFADGKSGGGIGNYLADGDTPWTDEGISMQADGRNGMQVGRAQIFNKPTAVRLAKTDSVVPLSYRAKAKVRPSAALPAMMGASRAA